MTSPSDPVIRLRRLDACAVSDALDKLQVHGAVSGLGQLASARRIAGRVTTVKLKIAATSASTIAATSAAAPPTDTAAPPRHLCAAAIEASGPDSVIVVEQRTGIEAGCWGGLLTLGARMRQVAGVVAEGRVRDIDEARHHDFPVFARGSTTRTARGRVAELGTHVDIVVGDVRVRDGDYVIADRSGVVFIAADRIDAVLAVAEQIAAKEAAMAKALLDGQPITRVLGASYEHMLNG